MAGDDFQARYANVMDSMLKSAVAETTKLFETMVNELKAEMSIIKKENEDLKSKCNEFANAKNQPTTSNKESDVDPGPSNVSDQQCDTGVQCELVPLRTALVEQREHEDTEEQMAFTLIKQEVEDLEPALVCRQVPSEILGSPEAFVNGVPLEVPPISQSSPDGGNPLLQKDGETPLETPGAESQASEPEHIPVITPPAVGLKEDLKEQAPEPEDALDEQPEFIQQITETSIDGPTDQEGVISCLIGVEEVEVSSHPFPEAGQPSEKASHFTSQLPVQELTSLSSIASVQEAVNASSRDVQKIAVVSVPVSAESSSRGLSSEKELPQSQQLPVDMEEEEIQTPTIQVMPTVERLKTPSTDSRKPSSVQPRERRTSSPSLQDAMLLVEAMNAQGPACRLSMKDTVSSPQALNTQQAGTVATWQRPTPLSLQTFTPPPPSAQSSVKQFTLRSQTAASPSQNSSSQTVVKIISKQFALIPPRTTASPMPSSTVATSVHSHQQQQRPFLLVVAPNKQLGNTTPQKVIVMPRQMSSFAPHSMGALSPTQLSSVVSTAVAAHKNNLPPVSTAGGTPSLSPDPSKTIVVTKKSKFAILVPRQQQSTATPQTMFVTRPPQLPELPVAVSSAQSVSLSSGATETQTVCTATVSKKTTVSTETCSNLRNSPGLMQISGAPKGPSRDIFRKVNLTGSSLPASMKETAPVGKTPVTRPVASATLSSSTQQPPPLRKLVIPFSKMPPLATKIHPCLKTIPTPTPGQASGPSKEPNAAGKSTASAKDNAPETNFEDSSITKCLQPSVPPTVSMEVPEKSVSETPITEGTLPNEATIQEKPSSPPLRLIPIKLRGRRTTILTRMTVSPGVPVQQKTPSSDAVDTTTARAETSTGVRRCRRLRKDPLVAPQTPLETREQQSPETPAAVDTPTAPVESALLSHKSNDSKSPRKTATGSDSHGPPAVQEKPFPVVKLTRLSLARSLKETASSLKDSPVPAAVPSAAQEPPVHASALVEEPNAVNETPSSSVKSTQCTSAASATDIAPDSKISTSSPEMAVLEDRTQTTVSETSITSRETRSNLKEVPISSHVLASVGTSEAAIKQEKQTVSPVGAVQKKAPSAHAKTSTGVKTDSIVALLRSHLRTRLQASKPESTPESFTEPEPILVTGKKRRLAKDSVTPKKTTGDPIAVSSKKPKLSKDDASPEKMTVSPTSITRRRSRLSEDVASSKKTDGEPTSVTPKKHRLSKNGVSPKNTARKPTSVSPRMTRLTKDVASPKFSPPRPKLANGSVGPKETGATDAKKNILIQDVTSPKRLANTEKLAKATKAKKATSQDEAPQTKPLAENQSRRETLKKAEAKPARVSGNKSTLKMESSMSLSPAKKKKTSENEVQAPTTPQQPQTISPHIAIQPNQTPAPPGKRGRPPKHLATQVLPKRRGRPPKCRTPQYTPKRRGRPPNPTPNVFAPSVSLHVIPVRAPPIVSPLQPLAVIGRRLLKNQCGQCGRVFDSMDTLKSHVTIDHPVRPRHSCHLCGKQYPNHRGLSLHGRVHRNGRIHICPHCGKGFVYHFGLTKHIQMMHIRIKPFVCQICSKTFFTKGDVESHIRVHTGEKLFPCNLCERRFMRRTELNKHLRWHNGERRHWCPYCGKGFLDYNNMKRHTYTHTGEKPYSCPYCPKTFTQTGHQKKHIRSAHKDDLAVST